MNITQKLNRLEQKITKFKGLLVINDVNAKLFVQNLQKLYKHRKTGHFIYFETVTKQWLKLFIESKNKFAQNLWIKILPKITNIALKILLLDIDGLKFSLEFMSILVESGELTNIKNFNNHLDKFVTILSALYKEVFTSTIFHYQRLFFKLVYGLVLSLRQNDTHLVLLDKIFDAKLTKQILRIEKSEFETKIRSIINRINQKPDVLKTFGIVAKSIKIGDTIFEKPKFFTALWIDFNITIMEISFYFDDNGDFDIINIPIKFIIDIITTNNVSTELNIVLNSDWLPLESGDQYTIKGANYIKVTFLQGDNTNMLNDYIIPEYLNWIHENSVHTANEEWEQTIVNTEVLANDTDSFESILESNHSTVVINDSQGLVEPAPTTNGLFESFKQTIAEPGSQAKAIIVQRVDPLPKTGALEKDTETSTPVVQDSQRIVIERHHYREVYSEVTQQIQVQTASQCIQPKPVNEPCVENRVDLFVVHYDTRIEDNSALAKVERLNNWLNTALQNMNANDSMDDIAYVGEEFDSSEFVLSPSPSPPRKSQKRYLLRSQKPKQGSDTEKDLERLHTEFCKKLYNLMEGTVQTFDIPHKNFLENKVKRLKLEQCNKLIESFEDITETKNSIQKIDDNIKKLHHKLANKLDSQIRRVERYKATVAAHNAEIKELDAKSSSIIDQFKTNLNKTAIPAEKEIWNSYIMDITRNLQTSLLKNLY